MKVSIVLDSTFDSNDGIQQYIKYLGSWLLKNNHEVKFLVGESKDEGNFQGKIISLSKNLNFKLNGNVVSAPVSTDKNRLLEILQREKFDIFHFQIPFSPLMGGLILKNTNSPCVATFHIMPTNPVMATYSVVNSIVFGKSYHKFQKVMSVSKVAKKFAKNFYDIDSVVVPNMVDIQKFKNGKKIKKFDDGKKNIFFLGRLVPRKGALYLLKAYKKMIKTYKKSDVRIIIAGDGYKRKNLEQYVIKNKLKNVVFTGYISEEQKSDYLATANLCVFPAIGGESFGIVLIEAMAAGKPILAFANPGYKSVLEENMSESLVKNRDIDSLASKMFEIVTNPVLEKNLATKSEFEAKKYDINVVCPQIFDIYKSAINKY